MTAPAASPSMLDAALRYASLGWRVTPLHRPVMGRCDCGRATCAPGGSHEKNIGKHPRLAAWQKSASADEKQIREWWSKWPQANVGVVTGADSGIFVLDVDPDKGGEASLVALQHTHGLLPSTVEALTGSGGRHLVFKHPGGRMPNGTDRLGPGLDIRGDGGQIVVAPSLHRSGACYEWQPEQDPGSPLADAPAWLIEIARAPRSPAPAPAAPRTTHLDDRDARQNYKRAAAYLSRIPGAVAGQRGHDITWSAALKVVRGFDLSEHDAYALLASEYNPRCTPPWSERELRHKIADAQRSPLAPGFLLTSQREAAPPATVATAPGSTATQQASTVTTVQAEATQSRTIDGCIIPLTRESLRSAPPPRKYMLIDSNTGDGVFVQGKVGLLAASGGSGKTWSLSQLSVSVATGLTWFGSRGWAPVNRGRVLLCLGEEDEEEIRRRIHHSAIALGAISDDDLDLIVDNVTALNLIGRNVAMTTEDMGGTELPATPFAKALRSYVEEEANAGRPFTLIILDTLSRFAGFDVEKDNSAATRWVQVVETLTTPACGHPSVIVAHHLKKTGAEEDVESADDIRGASALKDGVRWAAKLKQEKRIEGAADLITLRIVKANGIPPRAPLILCRPNDGNEGALRLATRDEIDSHEAVSKRVTKDEGKLQEYIDFVLSQIDIGVIEETDKIIGARGPDGKGKNKQKMLAAVRKLVADGVLERPIPGHISRSVPGGSRSVPEPEKVRGASVPAVSPLVVTKGNRGTSAPGANVDMDTWFPVPEPEPGRSD